MAAPLPAVPSSNILFQGFKSGQQITAMKVNTVSPGTSAVMLLVNNQAVLMWDGGSAQEALCVQLAQALMGSLGL